MRQQLRKRLEKAELGLQGITDVYVLETGEKVYLPDLIALDLFFEIMLYNSNRSPRKPGILKWAPIFARTLPEPGEGTMAAATREWCRQLVAGVPIEQIGRAQPRQNTEQAVDHAEA